MYLKAESDFSLSSFENFCLSGDINENSEFSYSKDPMTNSNTFDSFSCTPKVPCLKEK